MDILEVKQSVIDAGHKLVESGLIARTWGNISCRVDDKIMVITPSGRDYNSITTDEIVPINIADASYEGNIKPSVEKGLHSAVYREYPEVNCVIHTHQYNASMASCLGVKTIEIKGDYPLLGDKVICADYALPGSKGLSKSAVKAIIDTSRAVILEHHGAVCFGRSVEEAFDAAMQLEEACDNFVKQRYLKLSGESIVDEDKMRAFSLSRVPGAQKCESSGNNLSYSSMRKAGGFQLYNETGDVIEVHDGEVVNGLEIEAEIHRQIYKKHPDINHITFSVEPSTKAVSQYGITLKPLLDDFAQIVGTKMKTVEFDAKQVVTAVKSFSAVFVRGEGALCLGNRKEDAIAVEMIIEKNSKALVGASLFNHIAPINWLECLAMRLVYNKKYSQERNKK